MSLNILWCLSICFDLDHIILNFTFSGKQNPADLRSNNGDMLTVVACYSLRIGVVAVQMSLKELQTIDYEYSLTEPDKRYQYLSTRFRVIQDSAPGQKNKKPQQKSQGPRWHFHVNQLYSKIIIEACFSFVCSKWRIRLVSLHCNEIIRNAVNIFKWRQHNWLFHCNEETRVDLEDFFLFSKMELC